MSIIVCSYCNSVNTVTLDEDLLSMRERLAFLAWDDASQVRVTIEPLQQKLI